MSQALALMHKSVLQYLDQTNLLEDIKSQCQFFKTLQDRAFHFVLHIDPSRLLDVDALLGNLVLNNPTCANKLFQEVVFAALQSLSLLPNCAVSSQVVVVFKLLTLPKLPSYQISKRTDFLSRAQCKRFVQYRGIVCGMTAKHKYTKSARFVCSEERCEGGEGNHFIRVHIPGAREAQTIRSGFSCSFCGSPLVEDISCRVLADKLIIELIEEEAFNMREKSYHQSISTYLRDDLVKDVEIGQTLDIIGIPILDIHSNILALEANGVSNIKSCMGDMDHPGLAAEIPETIGRILKDRSVSPWSFPLSLAYALGSGITPAGTFLHLKLGLLLSLTNSHSGVGCGDLLAISSEYSLVGRLMYHAASMAPRCILHSANTGSLTAAVTKGSKHSSGQHYIDGGSLLLASDGVCVIPDISALKKGSLTALLQALECGSVSVELPGDGRPTLHRHPKHCGVWAVHTQEDKGKLAALTHAFGLVMFADVECESYADHMITHQCLLSAMTSHKQHDPIIKQEHIKQYLHAVRSLSVEFSDCSERLIKGYYVASRRVRAANDSNIPITAVHTITRLSASHARLCLHPVVLETDVAAAVLLYEESITQYTGYSVLNVQPLPHIKDNNIQAYIGEENDAMMLQFMQHLKLFITNHADLDTTEEIPEE